MTPRELWHRASVRFAGIVHYVDGSTVYASRGAEVFRSDDGGTTWRAIWTAPVSPARRVAGRSRLAGRLTRSSIHHIHPLGGNRLCAVGFRRVYSVEETTSMIVQTRALDFSRPLSLCTLGDRAFFGEYKNNPVREPIHIWASGPGGVDWDIVWTFKDVRHVHGVYRDPYEDAIWVTTGDRDSESGVWRTTDVFQSLEPVLRGGQHARVVQPLFSATHVYFGTDAPSERNHIYRLDRVTGATEQLQEVNGPIFWGERQGDNFFFSTACEPSSVNERGWVSLWHSQGGETWRVAAVLRKDRWPMKLFQYGQVLFPDGPGKPDMVWLTPFATQLDQWSLCMPVEHFRS